MRIDVFYLPAMVRPENLKGRIVAVIDVLRATTTIITALSSGARCVIPCVEIDEARQMASDYPRDEVLLGGERQGKRIAGFDLGNSPRDYASPRVINKRIVFTTTNGTRAMHHARLAERVLLASFVNRSAVVRELSRGEHVCILCAGTNGKVSLDDVLVAGALTAGVRELGGSAPILNAPAWIAEQIWRTCQMQDLLLGALRGSCGGRPLVELGLENDIRDAAQLDRFSIVPRFDAIQGVIT